MSAAKNHSKHSNWRSVDIRRESRFLPTPSAFDAPVSCRDVWHGKTRIVWLPDGEKLLNICLFLLTKCTNVTDGQTDGRTDTDTAYDIDRAGLASRSKNQHLTTWCQARAALHGDAVRHWMAWSVSNCQLWSTGRGLLWGTGWGLLWNTERGL